MSKPMLREFRAALVGEEDLKFVDVLDASFDSKEDARLCLSYMAIALEEKQKYIKLTRFVWFSFGVGTALVALKVFS